VQNLLGGVYVERARDIKASIEYCSKERTRVAGPFRAGNLELPVEDVPVVVQLSQQRVLDVIQSNPNMWRSVRALLAVRLLAMPKRSIRTQLYYFWGSTGTGKTTAASRAGDVYWHDGSSWWDNYDQQETVIVDEYRGSFPVQMLLKLGDGTPFKVPVKGGYVEFNSARVVFCSNLSPGEAVFKYDGPTNDALARRFVLSYYASSTEVRS